jgi:hypothetical protein
VVYKEKSQAKEGTLRRIMDSAFYGTYMKAQAQQNVSFKTTSFAHIQGSKTYRKERRFRSYVMAKFTLKKII